MNNRLKVHLSSESLLRFGHSYVVQEKYTLLDPDLRNVYMLNVPE